MAKRPPPKSVQLTTEQVRSAIPRLEKRLGELEALVPNQVQRRGDPTFDEVEQKVNHTLADIFGSDSVDYYRHQIGDMDYAPLVMGRRASLHEIQDGYVKGRAAAVTKIKALLSNFKERAGIEGSTQRVFSLDGIDLHPEISRAAFELFQNGHYANAIEDACKALDGLVKVRSGRFDLNGTDLMTTVFSPKAPILKINPGQTESEQSEQQGMMFLCAGAMLAFRNPRAHQIMVDSAEGAAEILMFLSFLAKSVDRGNK